MHHTPQETTVFILAAGRGERMMPLTANTPKPLLKIAQLSLIEHHINRLVNMGFKDFIINIAYLGNAIKDTLGDGSRWGVSIYYSDEQDMGALETAGGIQHALTHIRSDYFLCVNADIWTDFDFTTLLQHISSLPNTQKKIAAIVLTKNPKHNLQGDFCLSSNHAELEQVLHKNNSQAVIESYTFTGIGLYPKSAFAKLSPGKAPLAPLLRQWIDQQNLFGCIYTGQWSDIGTPERLASINEQVANNKNIA